MSDHGEGVTPVLPAPLEYAALRRRPDRWGRGFLAVCGSMLLPGLGHVLAGRTRRGIFWFSLFLIATILQFVVLVVADLLPVLLVLVPACVVLSLFILVDSFLCGRRSEERMLGKPWMRYAAGLLLLVASRFLSPASLVGRYAFGYWVESFSLRSLSMSPTLVPGDHVLAHKRIGLRRWDLIVFDEPGNRTTVYVSRLVGLPGETIEIRSDGLYVNGQAVTPPAGLGPYNSVSYLGTHARELRGNQGAGCEGNPIHLAQDEYYILGDNTAAARDSRLRETPAPGHQLGAVPADHIKGRVTAIYWPYARWRLFRTD